MLDAVFVHKQPWPVIVGCVAYLALVLPALKPLGSHSKPASPTSEDRMTIEEQPPPAHVDPGAPVQPEPPQQPEPEPDEDKDDDKDVDDEQTARKTAT